MSMNCVKLYATFLNKLHGYIMTMRKLSLIYILLHGYHISNEKLSSLMLATQFSAGGSRQSASIHSFISLDKSIGFRNGSRRFNSRQVSFER